MSGAVAADTAGQNFAALGDKFFESGRVFVINVVDLVGAEPAGLSAAHGAVIRWTWHLGKSSLERYFVFAGKDGVEFGVGGWETTTFRCSGTACSARHRT